MPWFGWVYLVLLALVGLSGLALSLRAGQSKLLALARFAAVAVLAWGVVLYVRDAGASVLFAGALFVSVLLLAQKSVADARQAQDLQLDRAGRAGVAINGLLMLPAVAMGALAIWSSRA
ncbi:hypothetical protein CMZ84_07765 [Lysobacteraceae bacterium NML93-0399]|nr:hypothetical protein CMZ84_07765 [Xanthomonadaceae bacterium NML93-0399]